MLHDPIPQLKRDAGAQLARLVAHWNGDDAAYMLGTDRSRVAELRRGKLDRFSLETLIRYLARMRKRVELRVTECLGPGQAMIRARRRSVRSASRGNTARQFRQYCLVARRILRRLAPDLRDAS